MQNLEMVSVTGMENQETNRMTAQEEASQYGGL